MVIVLKTIIVIVNISNIICIRVIYNPTNEQIALPSLIKLSCFPPPPSVHGTSPQSLTEVWCSRQYCSRWPCEGRGVPFNALMDGLSGSLLIQSGVEPVQGLIWRHASFIFDLSLYPRPTIFLCPDNIEDVINMSLRMDQVLVIQCRVEHPHLQKQEQAFESIKGHSTKIGQ